MSHVEELRRKHATLKAEVEAAQRSPGMDTYQLKDLKKQKLRIKEEIERLTVSV
jgi:hypothetical protein